MLQFFSYVCILSYIFIPLSSISPLLFNWFHFYFFTFSLSFSSNFYFPIFTNKTPHFPLFSSIFFHISAPICGWHPFFIIILYKLKVIFLLFAVCSCRIVVHNNSHFLLQTVYDCCESILSDLNYLRLQNEFHLFIFSKYFHYQWLLIIYLI